jgi:prevent-host-death family protein
MDSSLHDRHEGRLVVDAPKTKAAARTIPLIGDTADALRQHRLRQVAERLAAGPAWIDSGHVFTTLLGTPIDPSNALHWWYRLTERAGVGRRRFHASRHTAATLLLEREVPLEVVSAILGHSGITITADVYAKVRQDAKRRALTRLGEYSPSEPPAVTNCTELWRDLMPRLLYSRGMTTDRQVLRASDSAPLTEVRDNLSEFIDEISQHGSDLVITKHGKPVAVVVGHEEYEALLETLNILSDTDTMAALAEAEADVAAGRLVEL